MLTNVPLYASFHFFIMDLRPRYIRYPSTIAPTVTQNSRIIYLLACCAKCDGIQPLDASSIAPAAETIPYPRQEMHPFISFRSNVSSVETSVPERHHASDMFPSSCETLTTSQCPPKRAPTCLTRPRDESAFKALKIVVFENPNLSAIERIVRFWSSHSAS